MPDILITHDGPLDIATGRSRHEVNWKNKASSWSALLKRLCVTHRTAENYAEYLTSKKPRQDEIKDVGGFIGGYLAGGRRGKGSVNYRQLITLDIDFGPEDIWGDFTLLYDCAAAIYSTHKHGPGKPRLRLILPLDRHVLCDEYGAIARKVAGNLGIEYFDDTTYQPERLMYWPSTSKDGQYLFKYQDGPWLCADEILASYRDWRDTSEWPVSERVGAVLQRAMKKAGDPTEKSGVVGAFCRTFSIHDAIAAYLPDVYTPCDVDGRYTYAEGSTSGGLVTYDDRFAYSHHGTDPTSMRLCNAWDLVRIHLYGLRDENVSAQTPVNKTPSHLAMEDFACKDSRVRKLMVSERLASAQDDFTGVYDADEEPADNDLTAEPESDEWQAELKSDKRGEVLSTIGNIAIILDNDPKLKKCFAADEFRQKRMIVHKLPWRKVTAESAYLKDEDIANLRKYLEVLYGISNNTKIKDALDAHFSTHGFHPVREYLTALKWDGRERVDTLLIDYLGAEDTNYVRTVTRKSLLAAVTRVYRPGVKFDEVLVLIGKQGIGKSTIIKMLGGEWFSDSFNFHMLQTNKAYEQIQGVWLVEIGELSGLRKADIESAKSFISKTEDSYRAAYAAVVGTAKRQCVFFGTTNNRDFLRDPSGDRRFWPVDTDLTEATKHLFTELTPDEVAQVWAEMVVAYKSGEPLHLDDETKKAALQQQREHSEQDDRAGLVQTYLDTKLPHDWYAKDTYGRRAWLAGATDDELQPGGVVTRTRVCAAEIWCEVLGGSTKDMSNHNTRLVHDIMRKMEGWEQGKSRTSFKIYGNQVGYYRQNSLTLGVSDFDNLENEEI